MKFESSVKEISHSQDKVYGKLSDLNNLQVLKDKLQDPAFRQQIETQIPADKMASVQKYLDSLRIDADSVSISVDPVGEIGFQVVEREPMKCIKLASTKSPIGLKMWIQMLPVTESSSKIRLTVDADVNPFMGAMISKPLKEGVEKIAEVLTKIPYDL